MIAACALGLFLGAADPEVARVISNIATAEGELRVQAVRAYSAGCRGKNKFAFRKNAEALEALRPLFRDSVTGVRLAALDLPSCYDASTFEGEILHLLNDRDPEVRERAYEEAAHAGTTEMMIVLSEQVEKCGARVQEMNEEDTRWCVFALYALGESGKIATEPAVKKRVADLSVAFVLAPNPKLRQHGLRNLELCGTSAHVEALETLMSAATAKDAEVRKARDLVKKLKKRK